MTTYPQGENRLREQRERSRLTQEELAKLLDLDKTTVSKHECGINAMDHRTILRYARVFKIETHELFFKAPEQVALDLFAYEKNGHRDAVVPLHGADMTVDGVRVGAAISMTFHGTETTDDLPTPTLGSNVVLLDDFSEDT